MHIANDLRSQYGIGEDISISISDMLVDSGILIQTDLGSERCTVPCRSYATSLYFTEPQMLSCRLLLVETDCKSGCGDHNCHHSKDAGGLVEVSQLMIL